MPRRSGRRTVGRGARVASRITRIRQLGARFVDLGRMQGIPGGSDIRGGERMVNVIAHGTSVGRP